MSSFTISTQVGLENISLAEKKKMFSSKKALGAIHKR